MNVRQNGKQVLINRRSNPLFPSSWQHSTLLIGITALLTWTIASFIQCQPIEIESPVYVSSSKKNVIPETPRPETPMNATSGASLARVYPKFEHPFPCFEGESQLMTITPAHEGLLFQRPHKVGSTTMVGIVLRLAHNRANSMNKTFEKCKHRTMHGTAIEMEYGQRDVAKSFLLSILRHPTKRAISDFFHFGVTAHQIEPTDENFKNWLRNANYDHYLKDLTTRTSYVPNSTLAATELQFIRSKGYDNAQEYTTAAQSRKPGTELMKRELASLRIFGTVSATTVIEDILNDYNFIAVLERLDESLVVLQMLLGLTTKDILYTRARSSGTFSNGWKGRPCFFISHSFLTDGMKDFFVSEEWEKTIQHDLMLYEAANASLDRTIDALGRKEFKSKLLAFQQGLTVAAENCRGRVIGICSESGEEIPRPNRTCYVWSEGCDHECLNEIDL